MVSLEMDKKNISISFKLNNKHYFNSSFVHMAWVYQQKPLNWNFGMEILWSLEFLNLIKADFYGNHDTAKKLHQF